MSNRLSQLPVEVLIGDLPPVDLRVSQVAVEVLRSDTIAEVTTARLSQAAVEVLIAPFTGPNDARLSHLALEVLREETPAESVRVSQLLMELTQQQTGEARVSQAALEYGWGVPGEARVSQLVIEIAMQGVGEMPQPVATHTLMLRRLRQAPHLSTEQFTQFIEAFELDLEAGVGTLTGAGVDPQIMLRVSRDGGKTWGPDVWVSAGQVGQYDRRAIWRRLGTARDAVFQVVVDAPVKWALLNAHLQMTRGVH